MKALRFFVFFLMIQVLWVSENTSASTDTDDGVLFRENYESRRVGRRVDDLVVNSVLLNGSFNKVGRAVYVPNHQGTPRLGETNDLEREVNEATLSYDVYFPSGFEWARGGKLHGLGGGTRTSGCRPAEYNGWTVRVMWRENGVPELYIYDQNRQTICGRSFTPNVAGQANFKFQKGRWYRVDMYVRMNSPVGSFNGQADLYIDGVHIAHAGSLRLTGTSNVKVDSFLLTTFYGGNDPSWSPSRNTTADFDNFVIRDHFIPTGINAKVCELDKHGIYNPFPGSRYEACCDDSCGSCGGPGCGSRPGGSSSCCSANVHDNKPKCSEVSAAPCSF